MVQFLEGLVGVHVKVLWFEDSQDFQACVLHALCLCCEFDYCFLFWLCDVGSREAVVVLDLYGGVDFLPFAVRLDIIWKHLDCEFPGLVICHYFAALEVEEGTEFVCGCDAGVFSGALGIFIKIYIF